MTEGQRSTMDLNNSPLAGWQVYVYFKVKPEVKKAVIDQSLKLAEEMKRLGVHQNLKMRVDSGSHSGQESIHTLMEVYTPSNCYKGINLEDFIDELHNCSLKWAGNLQDPPQRITEVFVDLQGL